MERRWKRLEDWLFDGDKLGKEFSAREYAADKNLSVDESSADIQSYLLAQRTKENGSQTLFVLRRLPGTRTRNARWTVGLNKKDARAIGIAFSDDVKAKALRAFRPDLLRIAELNPRQAKYVERQIEATMDHALVIVEMAAQGMSPEEG